MKEEAEAKAAAERAEAEAKVAAEQAQAVNILQYYRGAQEPPLVAHYRNEAGAASKHADGTGTDGMDVFRPQYSLWMKLLFVSYNLEFASDRVCKRLDGLYGLDHDGAAPARRSALP
jgi:hypothetical protein